MAEMLSPKSEAELTKIKVPTLILWGDKETVFPRANKIDSLRPCQMHG